MRDRKKGWIRTEISRNKDVRAWMKCGVINTAAVWCLSPSVLPSCLIALRAAALHVYSAALGWILAWNLHDIPPHKQLKCTPQSRSGGYAKPNTRNPWRRTNNRAANQPCFIVCMLCKILSESQTRIIFITQMRQVHVRYTSVLFSISLSSRQGTFNTFITTFSWREQQVLFFFSEK